MSIPKNIQKEHLLEAINKIDDEGIPNGMLSKFENEVIYKDRIYPPKLIVAYANLFANGKVLSLHTFQTGKGSECFKLLEENGFSIVKRNADFSPTLLKFLKQANEPKVDLKKQDYQRSFNGPKIKISFGTGNPARIPWIAFLRKGQEVQEGIYPVYLYYKEQQTLILAYGVSETKPPKIMWDEDAETVTNFFQANFSVKPDRYGTSFVFASYDIDPGKPNFGLDLATVNEDLIVLTNYYNSLNLSSVMVEKNEEKEPFSYEQFLRDLEKAHLNFSRGHVQRFICSLCTKPFVILMGLSGSGKTKLAQAFAQWLCKNKEQQICIVPIGADWTNREPLLGFPNALEKQHYIFPENGVLSLIIRALDDPKQPYFLILDEMNLSHVERYFADFLSAMESGADICLHPGEKDWESNQELKVPPSISLPPNLFIIGTVNIDETTYMFSPKVLDRANVIEFRVSREEMEKYFKFVNSGVQLGNLDTVGAAMGSDFVEIATNSIYNIKGQADLHKVLLSFFDVLKKVGAEFGYRSAAEILRFTAIAEVMIHDWTADKIIDVVIMQKLLPKLHGPRRKLEAVLEELGQLCIKDETPIKDFLISTTPISDKDEKIKYPLSLDKIKRMHQRVIDYSFTGYAET